MPSEPQFQGRLAELLLEEGKDDEAEKTLQQGFDSHPNDSYTALTLLDFLLDTGNLSRAQSVFDECVNRFPWSVTYSRGVRLGVLKKDDAQARHWFDRLLVMSDPGEWAIQSAVSWMGGLCLPSKMAARLQYALEEKEDGVFNTDVVAAWASVAVETQSVPNFFTKIKEFADRARNRADFLSQVLSAVGGCSQAKRDLLMRFVREFREDIEADDEVWSSAMCCLHNHYMEDQAITLGGVWQKRNKAPLSGMYYLAECYGTKDQWQTGLSIAEHALSRSTDNITSWLHLTLACYGYALGRHDLFDRHFPLVDSDQFNDQPHYQLCCLTNEWRSQEHAAQSLNLWRYGVMAKLFKRLNGKNGIEMMNLIEGHLIEIACLRELTPMTSWLIRSKKKRLKKLGCRQS